MLLRDTGLSLFTLTTGMTANLGSKSKPPCTLWGSGAGFGLDRNEPTFSVALGGPNLTFASCLVNSILFLYISLATLLSHCLNPGSINSFISQEVFNYNPFIIVY